MTWQAWLALGVAAACALALVLMLTGILVVLAITLRADRRRRRRAASGVLIDLSSPRARRAFARSQGPAFGDRPAGRERYVQ